MFIENPYEIASEKPSPSIDDLHIHSDFVKSLENSVRIVPIEPNISNLYIGNFYGLLQYLSIPSKLHYVITRLNGLRSSLEYDGSFLDIKIVGQETLEKIRQYV